MSVLSNAMVGRGSSGGATGVERSVRLRASASASFSWTPGSAGDRKKLSRRFCVKRSRTGTLEVIASAGTASIDRFYFDSSDRLCLDVLGTSRLVSTRVFRDPTEFLIVGFDLDVANGTSGLRAKILVDEVEVSSYSTDGRASITNTDTNWNNTVVHYYGRDNAGNYLDGYITQVAAVNSSNTIAYAQANSNGILVPIDTPTATWGTNGHFLNFRDASAATAAAIGKDSSGNGNNWTPNNISVTAGVTYDSMYDYPVNGASGSSGVIGGYATLNPLLPSATGTLTNAALTLTGAGAESNRFSTIPLPDDKIYFEITCTAVGTSGPIVGISNDPNNATTLAGFKGYFANTGNKFDGTTGSAYGASWTTGNVIGVEYDGINKTISFRKDNTSQGTAFSSLSGAYWAAVACSNGGVASVADINFGQRPFAYTPPTGFKALCTANLPSDAVVTSGSFTGNAAADGPVVYLKGNPTALTINGNAVTFGTHADKLATGFKLRTNSASYNASGTNNFTATAGDKFANNNRAQGNP